MKADTIKITVLPDGTIKMETDAISMPNHTSATSFVNECARLAGGATDIKQKHKHAHGHTHEHEHTHEDHRH